MCRPRRFLRNLRSWPTTAPLIRIKRSYAVVAMVGLCLGGTIVLDDSLADNRRHFAELYDWISEHSDPDDVFLTPFRVQLNREQRTITISDNGIGMNRSEVIENIGTIAKSGTRQFFESLTGDQAKDSTLIGQFGVGFYSAFIIAEKVAVISRRAGLGHEHGVRW